MFLSPHYYLSCDSRDPQDILESRRPPVVQVSAMHSLTQYGRVEKYLLSYTLNSVELRFYVTHLILGHPQDGGLTLSLTHGLSMGKLRWSSSPHPLLISPELRSGNVLPDYKAPT